MKHLTLVISTVAWLLACAVLAAEQQSLSDGGVVPPGLLHRPQDVAPRELVIVPRDPSAYRPKGGLLAGAQHQARRVDTDELLRRKYDFYAGRMVRESLPGPGGPVSPFPACPPAGPDVPGDPNFAGIAYGSFVAACALAAVWLLTRILVNACRRPLAAERAAAPRTFESSGVGRGPRNSPQRGSPHLR